MEKKPLSNIQVPEFKNYVRIPNNALCKQIDSTRLLVEILGGLKPASEEFKESELSSRLLLDGQYSLVIRYRKEKDGKYYPACALSFDLDENGIIINQLQGSKDKKISYKFNSSFNSVHFYIDLIEQTFSSKGIFVSVTPTPKGTEEFCNESEVIKKYERLRIGIEKLNKKYGLTKNT